MFTSKKMGQTDGFSVQPDMDVFLAAGQGDSVVFLTNRLSQIAAASAKKSHSAVGIG